MTITGQVLDLAPKDAEVIPGVHVPGFTGQGWSSHETMLAVRWLFAHPDAWDQAMTVARDPMSNPHTVADTLHEKLVPRSELDAIAAQGFDPAKINWLEVAHELIERRGDPQPAAVSLAAQDAADDPAAAMTTARHLHDTGRHLAAASGHLDAAREAGAGDPDDHIGQSASHLDGAHASAHALAAHLRDHYPAEGADLDALTETIGLARSVSDQARTATTAHLVQTTLNHLGHTIEHAKAMAADPDPKVWEFNWQHARTHLDGALEHAAKLARHLQSNYPEEGRRLAELKAGGTISAQASARLAFDLASNDGGRDSGTALQFGQPRFGGLLPLLLGT